MALNVVSIQHLSISRHFSHFLHLIAVHVTQPTYKFTSFEKI